MSNSDYLIGAKQTDNKTYSLLLIGSPGVGKTAISKRFSENKFDKEYTQNEPIPIWNNILNVNNQLIKVQLTDCDDLPDHIMGLSSKSSYLHFDGYILCYSIENKRSFEMIRKFNAKLDELHSNKAISKIIISNKCDIINNRVISSTEGNNIATELKCFYYECSAKSGENINEIISNFVGNISINSSKMLFSGSSFDKFIYWFEKREKMINRIFYIFTMLHFVK